MIQQHSIGAGQCNISAIGGDATGTSSGDLVSGGKRQRAVGSAEIKRIAFEVEIDVVGGLQRDIRRLA